MLLVSYLVEIVGYIIRVKSINPYQANHSLFRDFFLLDSPSYVDST
jgi:hypothetical protein